MFRTTLRALLCAVCLTCALPELGLQEARATDLFYNYYVGPPGVPAQMYVSPRPTPPYVGHTWITYQPLMPHEFLYHHKRTYYRYHPSGHTTTSVRWH